MRETLDAPRCTYYQSLNQTISDRAKENNVLNNKIIGIHEAIHQRYEAPKIHVLLKRSSYTVGIKRVQRFIKEARIRSIVVKKLRPTPSKEKVVERDNLLDCDFSIKTINKQWIHNIIYIHSLLDGWCYLSSIMDLHSKKVIGYSVGQKITVEFITKALENAYHTKNPGNRLIFHSDLSSQYTSVEFSNVINRFILTPFFLTIRTSPTITLLSTCFTPF